MPADLKVLCHQWVEQVWNNGDEQAIHRMMDNACPIEGLGDDGAPLHGPDGFKVFWHKFRSAFPDLHIDVTDVVSDGDKAAVRIVMTGTHTGPGPAPGAASTHRKVRMTGLCLAHWKNGKIISATNEYDAAGLHRQLTA